MAAQDPTNDTQGRDDFADRIGDKAARKRRGRRQKARSIWHGLGTFGMVGWSVAVPTLLGVLLGLWLDARMESAVPWTLVLLIGGLILGLASAWQWVEQERKDAEREKEEARRE